MRRAKEDVTADMTALRRELLRRPLSISQIQATLGDGIDETTARRYLKRLAEAGDDVERVGIGYPVRFKIEPPLFRK